MSEESWRVEVEVPLSLSDDLRESLFDAVAEAAHDWEPEDRDGWDVFVSAGSDDHGWEARVDFLGDELGRVQEVADYAKGRIDKALALCDSYDADALNFPTGDVVAAFRAILNPRESK